MSSNIFVNLLLKVTQLHLLVYLKCTDLSCKPEMEQRVCNNSVFPLGEGF